MKNRRDLEKRALGSREGFTLIEVLLVVAILGILAGVAAVSLGGRTKGAKVKAARVSIANVCTAIDLYELDMGKYPSGLADLTKPAGDLGPWLKGGVPTDPWAVTLKYTAKERDYVVLSAGPDGQFGGIDDISSFTNVE
jgi:general secretion pathway protein G